MGTQKEIATKIRKKRADYVLALKGNQSNLHDEVKKYFNNSDFVDKCEYHKTVEKARSSTETREYWQTDNVKGLTDLKKWTGLKSIIATKNTIEKNDKIITETRYFISSLKTDVKEAARAIRSHWMVESYHWHLDVTFHEDDNRTLDKQAAYNLNILRKISLNLLKVIDIGKKASLKLKRYAVSMNPIKYLENLFES